jgi:hypothetical protein
MSNELIVRTVAAAHAVGDTAGQPRLAAGAPSVQPKEGAAASPAPNPSLQLDPALGLVVIEFRNHAGDVTTSIPSQRQILAYQRWQTTQFGPVPQGMDVAPAVDGTETVPPRRPGRTHAMPTAVEQAPTATTTPVKRG